MSSKNERPETFYNKLQKRMYRNGKGRSGNDRVPLRLFKRKELVQPRMNNLDEARLMRIIYNDLYKFKDNLEKDGKKVVSRKGDLDVNDISNVIPKHLVHDIFSMYFRNPEKDEISIVPEFNRAKYSLLEKVTDSIMQIITGGNYINSYFFTRSISEFIYSLIVDLASSDPELAQSIMMAINADPDEFGGENDQKAATAISKLLSTESVQQKLKKALKKAESEADDAGEFSKTAGKDPGALNEIRDYEGVIEYLKNINLSKSKVNSVLNFIMKTSVNYFTHNYTEREISVFDAEEINEILDIQFLLEPYKRFNLPQVGTLERSYKGKFNLYIDCSGSMGNSSSPNSDIIIAKAVAISLLRMRMVKEVYFFDTRIYGPYKTELEILKFSSSGGTSFKAVTEHASKNKENALVITDGEDYSAGLYLKDVFWFGVGNATLDNFNRCSTSVNYLKNKQVVKFNNESGSLNYIRPQAQA